MYAPILILLLNRAGARLVCQARKIIHIDKIARGQDDRAVNRLAPSTSFALDLSDVWRQAASLREACLRHAPSRSPTRLRAQMLLELEKIAQAVKDAL
ncbi:hypothetical protein NIES4075_51880 [Tolypothrix sp. NIES-4075]|uniref:hypothetical protein n=1 Tax=Tolypothrix sp. NIES-4075 TaxID=2005459 RepID=UPI000B5CE779|nr:hypothetical protein [Tolypothrix sp. NIES-4075]GAX44171.1 hypothetical protein NIES4075_51880 [Tolypothrix sp. NIES-4075]